jgi:hypothetical protein
MAEIAMRRQFSLPAFDVAYLGAMNLQWEAIKSPPEARWLLVHAWPIRPAGYKVSDVLVALQIPPGYPDAQLDMVYFYPPLERQDGRAISAVEMHNIDGKSFQRWSRHRTGVAPWRPGEDDVSSHLVLVDDWLERELAKP